MTRNPMVTRDTTSATEALQLMVERHFRHLVCFLHARPRSNLTGCTACLQRGRQRRWPARHHQSLP